MLYFFLNTTDVIIKLIVDHGYNLKMERINIHIIQLIINNLPNIKQLWVDQPPTHPPTLLLYFSR